MPEVTSVAELVSEGTDVLATLHKALNQPAFRLAVALLLFAENWNQCPNCAEYVPTPASQSDCEERR